MGFWSLITGEDLEEAKRQSDAADAWNLARNKELLDEGKLTQENYDISREQITASALPDPAAEVSAAFDEGFQDGVDNVRGAAGSILALPFRLIPPIAWVLIAVGLFFYFGGGVLVRRKVTSK